MSNDKDQWVRRRRVPRRDLRRKIGLLIKGTYHINVSHQVGEGGMMISSLMKLKKNQLLVITFRIPGYDQTVVRGIVRYNIDTEDIYGYQYGIEFVNLEFRARREIRNFVASRSADEESMQAM